VPLQGRFQLVLVTQAGHAVQEDNPETTAAALALFVRRCTRAQPQLRAAAASWTAC
jgi:hypothetical protein